MENKWLKVGLVVISVLALYVAIVVGSKLIRGNSTTPTTPTAAIEFWNVFDKTSDIQPLLDEFTAKYGIKVNYRSFPDANAYREELLTALASGSGPDVFALHRSQLDRYRTLIASLPSIDLNYSAANVSQDFVDVVAKDVVRSPLSNSTGTKKVDPDAKEVVALPLYVDSLGLIYNAAMYKNILAKPSGKPETTWAGVAGEVAKLATRSGTNSNDPNLALAGIALGRGDNISRTPDIFSALLLQRGVTSLAAAGTTNVHFTQPMAEVLDFTTGFSRDSRLPYYSWNQAITAGSPEREIDAFARGKVALIVGYSYYLDRIQSQVAQLQRKLTSNVVQMSDVRAASLPQLTDPRLGGTRTTLADYFALTTGKNSKLVHEGWQLILFLTSHDSEQKYFAATKKPASRRDLLEAESQDFIRGAFAEGAVYADSISIPDADKYALAVNAMTDAVADGKLPVGSAVPAGERYLNCLLSGTTDCTFSGN